MKALKLAFIGYGDLGRQIEQLLSESKCNVAEKLYFDDVATNNGVLNSRKFSEFLSEESRDFMFVLSIGYHHLKKKHSISQSLLSNGRSLFTFIHDTAIVSRSATISPGSILYPGCKVCMNVHVGIGTGMYNGCNVAHDVSIGECCFLAPGVTIAGHTRVSDRCFIGCGSTLTNDITLGEDCIVGLASAVTKSVPTNASVFGNPARILGKKLNLL